MYNYGTLFIVATPIGNLEDITLRAISTLKTVDLIVCEDTRVTSKLLQHYEISKPLVSYNNFNEHQKTSSIIEKLKAGNNIALVSDAGTPLISDPGYLLTKSCHDNNINIITVPGACSIIAALTISILPLHSFLFLGFLPKTSTKKQAVINKYKKFDGTIAIFESPNRLLETLKDIKEVFSTNQKVVVCRELTKIFEERKSDYIDDIIKYYTQNQAKGEVIILFSPPMEEIHSQNLANIIKEHISTEAPSYLAKRLSKELNINKTKIYNEILKIKNNE